MQRHPHAGGGGCGAGGARQRQRVLRRCSGGVNAEVRGGNARRLLAYAVSFSKQQHYSGGGR
jgi:hypothetical protein